MVFSSLLFLFRFLPIILFIYFIVPKRFRNAILFLFSLIFYAWGEPIYVVLMLFSTVVDYTHGILVEKFKNEGQIKKAKMVVASSMTINLLLLGFFKYSDFIIQNINQLFKISIPLLNLALPIGISFYTFQTMSYTVDVYRGQAKVQKNIISFGAYVALFPQLIAGPIVQYKTIDNQLNNREENFDQFSYGVMRFLSGLGKKVLLANNIGLLWDTVQKIPSMELPALTAWLGITAYAFQIYFDFSGYSDMAIGLGHMFGFRFLENFQYPYMSKSITEFWRRWHISLGSWFRDYVSHLYALFFIWIGWVIFALEDFGKVGEFLKAMFGGEAGFANTSTWYLLSNYGLIFLILIAACTDFPKRITIRLFGNSEWNLAEEKEEKTIIKQKLRIAASSIFIVTIFLLSVAYLVDASYNPFLYFRF